MRENRCVNHSTSLYHNYQIPIEALHDSTRLIVLRMIEHFHCMPKNIIIISIVIYQKKKKNGKMKPLPKTIIPIGPHEIGKFLSCFKGCPILDTKVFKEGHGGKTTTIPKSKKTRGIFNLGFHGEII